MSESEIEIQVGIIRSMLSDMPDAEKDLLAPAFASMRFRADDDSVSVESTDPFELDEGVESLAQTVSTIYASFPEQAVTSRLHAVLYLLGVVGSGYNLARKRLIKQDAEGELEPWAWDLLDSVFEEDPEQAVRQLPERLYPEKQRKLGNSGDLRTALHFIEGYWRLRLGDDFKEGDPSPIAKLFVETLGDEQLFPQKSRSITENDPETIYFWLKDHEVVKTDLKWYWEIKPFGQTQFTNTLLPFFQGLSVQGQARLIRGYLSYVFQFWTEDEKSPFPFQVLLPYYQIYVENLNPNPADVGPDSEDTIAAWLFLGRMICQFSVENKSRLPEAEWAKMKATARSVIGRLPAHFRGKDDESEVELNEELIKDAVSVIHFFDNTFFNLKQFLRTLREAQFPLVLPELRYWVENGRENDPFPKHAIIPERVSFVLRTLRQQQEADPELLKLRNNVAEYCLERLKPKSQGKAKTDRDNELPRNQAGYVLEEVLNESDPIWRLAYIEAASVLRVKAKGRGHHTLHWISQNDPREEVRNAARSASKPMRHGSPIPKGSSPRRPLFAAFWYLRRAHLESLGIIVDQDGANWTRMKEISYTKFK